MSSREQGKILCLIDSWPGNKSSSKLYQYVTSDGQVPKQLDAGMVAEVARLHLRHRLQIHPHVPLAMSHTCLGRATGQWVFTIRITFH